MNVNANFYSVWDELNRLTEAEGSAPSGIPYDDILKILKTKDDTAWKDLREFMINFIRDTPSMRSADVQNWPYQLQLLYNAHILESKAIEILNSMGADELKQYNKRIRQIRGRRRSPAPQLPLPNGSAKWDFSETDPHILSWRSAKGKKWCDEDWLGLFCWELKLFG